ncbi:MAG: RNA methyltransferase [Clostridia bacterium]|nr:RNA methyltransferase [Clostridia bacterium]
MVVINSKANSIIKYAVNLKNKKYSKKFQECLVETDKLVIELLDKGLVSQVLVTEDKVSIFEKLAAKAKVKLSIISDEVSKYLSDAVTSCGVFAVVKIPQSTKRVSTKALILDGMQDPSNLGAVIRSARAFGYDNIYLVDSVYPYSYKVIRASMGYVFDINLIYISYDELSKLKETDNFKIIVADMDGKDLSSVCKIQDNYAIVIGNEGNGISSTMLDMADMVVSIPMQNGVESLNASVSASIIMYKLNELKEK